MSLLCITVLEIKDIVIAERNGLWTMRLTLLHIKQIVQDK